MVIPRLQLVTWPLGEWTWGYYRWPAFWRERDDFPKDFGF